MIHRPPDRDKLGDFSPVACQCDGFSLQYSLDGCPEVFAQITSSHQSAFRKSEEYFIRVKRILPNIVRSSWNIVHIVEIVQISDINTFVNKDFFNQAAFMNLVSDELSKRDIPQVRLTEALGKAESAFQRWMHPKKPKRLDVNEIIAICHFFEWRPSWALFGEGPQSDAEAHEIALIRDVIALLGDDARRAVGNAQYVPEPQLKKQVAETTKKLSLVMGMDLVELPRPVYDALRSTSTLLRLINVPQVSICRATRLQADAEVSLGAPQGGE